VLHLNSQIRASHVNEHDGDDQQTVKDCSHVFSQSLRESLGAHNPNGGRNLAIAHAESRRI
jgi:hypothetical protein